MINLGKASTTLIAVSQSRYLDTVVQLAKEASKGNVCYVTYNKTCLASMDLFNKNNVDTKNIKFIDGLTNSIQNVKNTADCTYLSSPEAITELSIVIDTHLKYPFDYFIFDPITNLILYSDEDTISRLLKGIIIKISRTKCKAVFLAIDTPASQKLIQKMGDLVDKVITIA